MAALSDGRKVVLAVESGYRESKESWVEIMRGLKSRGLTAPRLLIADGSLGIWSALPEVFPQTSDQRCWNHKIVNVLDKLPKKLQSQARELLCKIPYEETREAAEQKRDAFAERFRKDHPKAVACLLDDWERMVTFYAFPKEHWTADDERRRVALRARAPENVGRQALQAGRQRFGAHLAHPARCREVVSEAQQP